MKVFSKNTIQFPKKGSIFQKRPEGENPKIRRISDDDIIPVVLEVTNGLGSSISSGDLIFPGDLVCPHYSGREIGAPSDPGETFTLSLTDGKVWNDFSKEPINFFVGKRGKIKRISADDVFPIVLEYDENVNPEDLKIRNFIYYNSQTPGEEINQLIPRQIIAHEEEDKQIFIGDFLLNDSDTHDVNFDIFPVTWTENWTFSEYVQLIQTVQSGGGDPDEYELYIEIMGKRTENLLLYLDWDFENDVSLIIKSHFYGYFFPDKVGSWYSIKDIYKAENYYSDSIETINIDTSSFVERTLEIGGEYKMMCSLSVPASVRFVKFLISTEIEEIDGELILDIKENTIGFRN